jgi:predicted Rossmann fold nucleotide-binding protein DprA/Smf involved in DNA uptake
MTESSPDRASPDRARAALLLTNRLVPLDAAPMTAREFWQLVERVDPADLVGDDVAGISQRVGVGHDEAVRLRTLLDAATGLTFEQERLHDNGISLVSALDARFPSALRSRLGTACPPFLLVAGPIEWLGRPGLGVVGSREASDVLLAVARRSGELAVGHRWPVVSGLARGVDQAAMAGALDADGEVIGVPAEGISRAARSAEVRRRVHAGELCLASPYAPDAPFRPGNAMGRNKIIYALSQVTFVVSTDEGSGGTWAGATEALERRYARVAVWVGDGANDANHVLAARGAVAITDLTHLFDIDPVPPLPPPPQQHSLF